MKSNRHIILASTIFIAALVGGRAQTTFTKITEGNIVNDPGLWVGGTWADLNGDGLLDLLVCNYAPGVNAFYLNNGDGKSFTKVAQGDPVVDVDYHVAAAAGDFNNDGALDLFITAGAFAPSATANTLYQNAGAGIFRRVSGGTVTNHLGHFGPAAWGDYDNDGFLDLFVANHGDSNSAGGRNLLYHNNGDGTFTNVTSGSVVNDFGVGFAAGWADYDGDGLEDLLVINYNNSSASRNFLYHNNGNGDFTRVLTSPVATDTWSQGATCGAWGDYDNDGFPDLFVTDGNGVRNQLYHNDGKGGFTRVTTGPELLPSAGGSSNGCSWGDYDNDGYLDLFVSNFNGSNALFHNNGDGTFSQILSGDPVEDGGPGIGCASVSWVDYDNDGFLDLFVGVFSSSFDNSTPGYNLLYHNDGNTNSWLEVKLAGTVANRSAIGAKVRLHATIAGKSIWQARELNGGVGYDSRPLVAHFGLGDANAADTVRIEWPSGTVQEFHNVSAKQILTYLEPPRLLTAVSNGVPQLFLKCWSGPFVFSVESSGDLKTWSFLFNLAVAGPNGTTRIPIDDLNTGLPPSQFYRVKFPALYWP